MLVSPASVDASAPSAATLMSDSEDISDDSDSDSSAEGSEQQETEDKEAEQELVVQSEARLPANRRATRTMR